jgi:uncharacterized protein YjbI with pentapeptide repeats
MNTKPLNEVLTRHTLWIDSDGVEGARAILQGMDLQGMDLQGMDLQEVNLQNTDLRGAILCNAYMWGAALQNANMQGANLQGANLWRASLQGADLLNANLTDVIICNCVGNGKEIQTIHTDLWLVTWTNTDLAIGYQQYKITKWWEFTDEEIQAMNLMALPWWRKWKPKLQQLILKS